MAPELLAVNIEKIATLNRSDAVKLKILLIQKNGKPVDPNEKKRINIRL